MGNYVYGALQNRVFKSSQGLPLLSLLNAMASPSQAELRRRKPSGTTSEGVSVTNGDDNFLKSKDEEVVWGKTPGGEGKCCPLMIEVWTYFHSIQYFECPRRTMS